MNDINQSQTSRNNNGSSLAIPIAIVVGFGLIASAIYFGDSGKKVVDIQNNQGQQQQANLEAINPITAEDHIKGNPNAEIVIVEYSDFDCPFCRNFHTTLNKVMDEYGATGKVAWVYRHFPLTSLHPSAAHIAEASECVAELGGTDAFWTFSDLVFMERGTNEPTNIARLPEFATTAGVNADDFKSCLDSGRNKPKVVEDFNNAVAIGGTGTPHSIIIAGDQKFVIEGGAQPYEVVKSLIDGLLE